MSPCLFAIFIDDIVTKLKSLGLGCNTILTCTSIFLYADDCSLMVPEKCDVDMLNEFQHVLNWAVANKLTINMCKT